MRGSSSPWLQYVATLLLLFGLDVYVLKKKDKRHNFNSARGGVFGGVTEARSWLRTDWFIRGFSWIGFTD